MKKTQINNSIEMKNRIIELINKIDDNKGIECIYNLTEKIHKYLDINKESTKF